LRREAALVVFSLATATQGVEVPMKPMKRSYRLVAVAVCLCLGLASGYVLLWPRSDVLTDEEISADLARRMELRQALKEGRDVGPLPAAALEPARLEFGTVPNDRHSTREVMVLNGGTSDLVIERVGTGCGCTKAEMEDRTVPPGEGRSLQVTVMPEHLAGFHSEKQVMLVTNDPRNRALKLTAVVDVEPEFELDPAVLDFGDVEKGGGQTVTVWMGQTGDEPLVIKGLEQAGVGLRASYEAVPETEWRHPGRAEYRVTLALEDDVPLGRLIRALVVHTEFKRASITDFKYLVRGNVSAFYDVKPHAAVLRLSRQGEGGTEGLAGTATVVADRPITVGDLAVSDGPLSASAESGDDPNSALVRVVATPDAKPGIVRGSLTFSVRCEGKTLRHAMSVSGFLRSPDQE
jgi:Protein of unknown function (DUF1573)